MTRAVIRRLLNRAGRRIDAQIDTGAGWQDTEALPWQAPFHSEFELARYEGQPEHARVLPVCPTSFRDFMVFEKHAIDAARGLTRRFMPAIYPVARAFERVTGRTFPPFRPHTLWYRQPIYYMSNALTLIPSGVPVSPPAYTTALDFELELGVGVIEHLIGGAE